MKKIIIKLSLLVMLITLTSCVKNSVVVTEESMKGKGLLVGHVSASGFSLGSFFKNGHVKISDETYSGALKNGYISVPLLPGKYEFNSLHTTIGNLHKTLPIKGGFTIKAGEVTNLGEVFLLFQRKVAARYNMIYLNNNDDMHAYLRSEYKEVYRSLKKTFNKADVKFVDDKYIPNVRRQALGQTRASSFNKYVFTGPLGSIGISKRNNKNKVIDIKWLKTDTFEEINTCDISKKEVICVVPHKTKGDRLFYSKRKKYTFNKKPLYFDKGKFKIINDGSILWVGSDFNIYRSRNGGKSWVLNYKDKNINDASKMGLSFASGKKGIYLYSKDQGTKILYSKYKSNKFSKITPPKNLSRLNSLVETSKGLYTGLEWTMFSDDSLYYKKKGSNQWVKRVIPVATCQFMSVKNYKKDEVKINCLGPDNILSSQEGKNMKKIGRK